MPNTDIIDKIISSDAYKDIERTNALLDEMFEKFMKAADAATKLNASVSNSTGMKELGDNTDKLNKENEELLKITKQIEATVARRAIAESELAKTLAQEKVLLQQANKENANAAKIALTNAGSLSRIDAVIQKLQARQRALNLTTEEGAKKSELYKKAIENLSNVRKKESDVIEKQRLNIGNYQGSAKIIVDALERFRQKSEQAVKQFGELSPEAQAARGQFEALRNITDQPQFLNISAKVGDTNKELRFFTKQLNQMEDAGLKNTEVYKEVQARLAHLTDQLGDTREEIKALSSDTRGFDLFAGSVSFAADTFQTFAGAAQLAGASEEDAAQATATLVAVQSVANGVKGIANELTTKGTAANKVYAFTQGLVSTALDKSAGAAKRFQAALGIIGLALTVIGLIVVAMGEMTRKMTDAEAKQQALNDVIKESAGDYAKAKTEVAQLTKEIDLAKKGILNKEDILKKYNDTIGKTIGQTNDLQTAEQNLKDKGQQYIDLMFAKSQAAAAFALANKAAEESVKNETATTEELLSTFDQVRAMFKGWTFKSLVLPDPKELAKTGLAGVEIAEKNRAQNRIDLQNKYNSFLDIGNQKLEEAGNIATKNGFKSDEQLKREEEERNKAEELKKKQKEDAKKIAEALSAFLKKLKSDETKSAIDLSNEEKQHVIDNLKSIVDNEKLFIGDRLIANTAYYKAQEQLIRDKAEQEKQAILDGATAEAESILKRKLNKKTDAALILQIEQGTANQRALIEKKAQDEIIKVRAEGLNQQQDLVKNAGEKLITALGNQSANELLAINKDEQKKLNELQRSYSEGNLSYENYEKKKLAIQNEYIEKRLRAELEAAKKYLAIQKALGNDTSEAQRKVAELEMELDKLTAKTNEDYNKKKAESDADYHKRKKDLLNGLYEQLKETMFGFLDNGFTKQKNILEKEKNLIEERKAVELDRINREQISEEEKAAKIQILNAQTDNQKKLIEQRQKQEQVRQAKFNKTKSAFEIGLSTAQGIMKTIAEVGLPAAWPLVAIIGATGALQLASVLSEPIPEYYTGTEDSKGGLVWLGERGKELLVTPDNKLFETPSTATMAFIPEHSKVINNDDYMNMLRNENVNSTLKYKPMSDQAFMQWQLKQAEMETQRIVDAINNKPDAIINITDYGIERFRKHGNSWTDYLNKKVRFKR